MTNPLLNIVGCPDFSQITLAHFQPAIEGLLQQNRELIEAITAQAHYTWDNFAEPLEDGLDKLSAAWSVVSLFNATLNSDAMREIYQTLQPQLTQFHTEFGQNRALCDAYAYLANSDAFSALSVAQQKSITNSLRDFRLSGVDLPEQKKQRYAEVRSRLSALQTTFSDNVLDATEGWFKHCQDASELPGLPEDALAMAKSAAARKDLEGYVLTLDIPSYFPVMSHCENRQLRKEMYDAYMTRASDQGPNAGRWDNTKIIDEILVLRAELASLLGFQSYAELSLATKMADSPDQVMQFLHDMADKSVAAARQEFAELETFARGELDIEPLEVWDVAYCSEKLRQQRYSLSQEELKPYFPEPRVLSGMFQCAEKLYGVKVEVQPHVASYHDDVQYYSVSRAGKVIAGFFLDTHAREGKRGGAWMANCLDRRLTSTGEMQLPVAYLCCNFTPPAEDRPALLRHEEVTTLFHEFGHGLHHMLTDIDVAEVSGINGVAWDAVELPSQFMENWCWQEASLCMISGHYQSGEALPKVLLDRLLAAKNFQSAMHLVRQLEFSLFDFVIHKDFEPGETNVLEEINKIRQQVATKIPPHYSRFSHAFSHIFAGGYAAGYYSYKWAEVLAADAFSRFEEEGLFNPKTGQEFLETVLEQGGSRDAMDLFEAFRGRKPSVEPLLKSAGIAY